MWRGRHESGLIAQQRGGGHWPVGGGWLTKVVHIARGGGDWMYWKKGEHSTDKYRKDYRMSTYYDTVQINREDY